MPNEIQKPNYVIHLIYALSLFLSVALIITYMVWSKIQLADAAKIKAQQIAEAESDRQTKIQICLNQAKKNYTTEWAAACLDISRKIQNNIKNCITYADSVSSSMPNYNHHKSLLQENAACQTIYGTPDSNPTCALPIQTANSFNSDLSTDQNQCNNTQ